MSREKKIEKIIAVTRKPFPADADESQREWHEWTQDKEMADFRAVLEESTDEQLADAEKFWLAAK